MSAVPDEAIKAIADALHGDACPADPDTGESCGCGNYEREAEIALTAAMPAIREQIAAEISNYWDACGELIDSHNGARLAFDAIITQIREGDA